MSDHPGRDSLLAAAEGEPGPCRGHLADCAACREEVELLREAIADARLVEVPEPSPLFWERLSVMVGEAIRAGAGEEPKASCPASLSWRLLVPASLAAAVALFGIVVTLSPREDRPSAEQVNPSLTAEAEGRDAFADEEAGWRLFADLAGEVDVETVEQTGLEPAPAVVEDELIAALTPEERAELVSLLRGEAQPRQIPFED